ncbi:MAG: hypothetical protein V4653_18025 [Pseudomonadota bacterium]
MDVFHWIIVPVSTVLGLTITRVLTGYVAAFKARGRLTFDWLPIVFAAAILGESFQFWWALLELSALRNWSLASFTLLLAMAMALFSAAALIVPSETDDNMWTGFERDGRWALAALAGFHLLALIVNGWLYKAAILSTPQALEALLAILCLHGGLTRRRRVQEIVAVLYALLSTINTFTASVREY